MASLGRVFRFHRGLWERICPYMWANYNVKPSTSKIENFIKLYRSQI